MAICLGIEPCPYGGHFEHVFCGSTSLDQLCCICGVVGYAELIVTCSKCKIVREHLYCMPGTSHDIPELWLCDNCTLDEAKSPDDSGLQAQPKMPRHGKTSKVKFLPAEEVVKLSSGGMKGPSKFNASLIPQRTSKSRKVFDIYNSVPRPLFKASKESQERSSAKMPPKVCGVNKQALATGLSPLLGGPVQPSKKVKVTDRYACTSSMSRHGLPVTSTGKQVPSTSTKFEDTQKERKHDTQKERKDDSQKERKHDTQKERKDDSQKERNNGTQKERKEALMTHEIYAYRDYLPSLYATWKGGFQFVDTRMAGEFYDGFLAKPPCVVHGRAYALSRKIPHILQVKLLSRSDIWDDLFHDEGPDLADIALYFFPSSNIERSSKNNSFLFELLERDDLLITSLIDGAELVVFTSRQLDLESQYVVNRLNAECLLFGVFGAIKDNQSPNLEERTAAVPMLEYGSAVECASRVPLLECTPKEADECESVNKEIDITSGNTSGPTASSKDMDATIQRLLLEFGSQNPSESDVCALTSNVQIKDQEPAPVSAFSSHSLSLSKVKTEPVIEGEGSDDKKCLKTEHCSIMVPSFSIDGYMTGLSTTDAPKRVADKYLQIFNAGIKKERP